MGEKIAVQENLDEIRSLLKDAGYEIVNPDQREGVKAFVITSGITPEENAGIEPEENVYLPTGKPHAVSYAPVIDATGKSAGEVADEVKRLANR
ncbi:YkuS family protein [Desulforudis sp. 1088]|uniref:YkuS family protein n=1 Tax=unclassified Candidatus Desulforudis TaxID=2635950 RepID=UPI003CE51047